MIRELTPRPDDLLARTHHRGPGKGGEYAATIELELTGVVLFESPWYPADGIPTIHQQLRMAADVLSGRVAVQLW